MSYNRVGRDGKKSPWQGERGGKGGGWGRNTEDGEHDDGFTKPPGVESSLGMEDESNCRGLQCQPPAPTVHGRMPGARRSSCHTLPGAD